jgi:hypothetical protein
MCVIKNERNYITQLNLFDKHESEIMRKLKCMIISLFAKLIPIIIQNLSNVF